MLWRVEQPAHLLTLTGHLQGLSDAAWAPDGRYLCTASDDQTVRVFDCTTGQVLRTFRGHQSYVCCCAYSPRGNVVASGSYDETIKLWDVRSARCLRSFGSHADPVTGLDFSWDGSLLASSSFDGLCRVWDAVTGTCIKTLLVDSNPFAFVSFIHTHTYTLHLPKDLHDVVAMTVGLHTEHTSSSHPTASTFWHHTWTTRCDCGATSVRSACDSSQDTRRPSSVRQQPSCVAVRRATAWCAGRRTGACACGTSTVRHSECLGTHTQLLCLASTATRRCR